MSDTATRPEELNDGTLTSWIPFTTPGPNPDPICSSAIYQMPGETTLIAFDNWYTNIVGEGGIRCLPTEVIEWRAQNTATVLSLGPFHCPSDYSTATTSAVDGVSTLVGCCPSGYDFKGISLPAGCLSTLTSGAVTVKSIYAPSGNWISWDDITISTAGVSVIGIQVEGYIFNSPTPASTADTQSTTLLVVGDSSAAATAPAATTPLPRATSSQNEPSSTFSSSETQQTMTISLQDLASSSSEQRYLSFTSTIITSISGTTATVFSTLPAPSATSSPYSGTATLSSSTPTSSPALGLSLGAKVGIGIGAGATVVALGFLIAFLQILHRRKYISSQSTGVGEKYGVGRAELVGSTGQKGVWSGKTERNETGGRSEENALLSRDVGPHELDGRLERPETS